MMKTLRAWVALAAFVLSAPAFAQWQTPQYTIPVGQGAGVIGFGNIAPGTAGYALVSNGPAAVPSFQPVTYTVGAPLLDGTSGCVVYDLSNTVGCAPSILVTNNGTQLNINATSPGAGAGLNVDGFISFLTPNAVWNNVAGSGAVPTLFQMAAGSPTNPILAITPTAGVSRYETTTADAEGGQNAAWIVSVLSKNTSSAGQSAQGNAIRVYAQQLAGGTADEVGVYSSCVTATGVRASDSHAFGCFGIFTASARTTNPATTLGANFIVQNNSGVDCPYSSLTPGGNNCGDYGVFVQADGSNLQGVGELLFNNSGQFDVGYAAWPGSIKTTAFEDDSSAVTSFKITGSHTTGIDMSTATLGSYAINTPGFFVTGLGQVTTTSNFQSNDGTSEGIWGSTSAFLTHSVVMGSLNAEPVAFLYNNALVGSIQSGPAWAFGGSVAVAGCAIGSNAFCVTGNALYSGSVLSSGATQGIGYSAGSGCSATQLTSRTTGVTCNTVSMKITLVSAPGTSTPATFTVTDSAVGADDSINCTQYSGANTYQCYAGGITGGASFKLTQAATVGTTTEQPVFNVTITKGAHN